MASPNSATAKMLKEHLQEQQEPFTLNIYVSDRGYLVKCLSSNGRNGCCQINLFKNLNKKMSLLSTRIVKSMVYKLTSATDTATDSQLELSCCSDKAHRDEFETAEANGCTEVKKGQPTPFCDSPNCSVEEESLPSKHRRPPQASNLGNEEEPKTLIDKTWQRNCTQEKHLNLMSVLNTLSSDKVHHIITRQETPTENASGNFIFTTFSWKSLGKSLIGFKDAKEIIDPCSPQQQTKKDLVNQRKASSIPPEKSIEKKGMNVRNKYNYVHWFIGAEDLGNLIRAEQNYSCRKNCRDSSMDFSNTMEEWNYSRTTQRKISFELGDTIMDDIVEEIIDLLLE